MDSTIDPNYNMPLPEKQTCSTCLCITRPILRPSGIYFCGNCGKPLKQVDRQTTTQPTKDVFYSHLLPKTQICSYCGKIMEPLLCNTGIYKCTGCGKTIEREQGVTVKEPIINPTTITNLKSETVISAPSHYCVNGYECRLVMKALGLDTNWNLANVFKYLWRFSRKNGLEDLKKAKQYLEFEISEKEKDKC